MDAIRRRHEISSIELPFDQAVEERGRQLGVLLGGLGMYLAVHKILREKYLRNRPVVPQFIAVIPALALVYAGGLYVRMGTLRREGLLS